MLVESIIYMVIKVKDFNLNDLAVSHQMSKIVELLKMQFGEFFFRVLCGVIKKLRQPGRDIN